MDSWKSLVVLLGCFFSTVNSQEHPCKRPCETSLSMTCVFYLVADIYYVNQPDCRNCDKGVDSDCDNKYCIPADGRFRMVKAFNYTIPGPTLEVCEHDMMIVYVTNNLNTETTSVHWHGMHQIGTPDMDGVPMVTQRPILPNERYRYQFTAYPAGTHFYHSHSGSQRADGLFGKLIVRKSKSRELVNYDVDNHSMAFLEWFPMLTDDITMRYQRAGIFYDVNPVKTILVDSRSHTREFPIPPTRYVVKRGLRHRFRMIHAGNIVCPIEVSIDNHKMLAFNSDGHDFEPVEVDSITLTNGERFDFVLNANQPIGQYVIRINSYLICNVRAYAILQYEGASSSLQINYNQQPNIEQRLNCVSNQTSGCIYYPDLLYDTKERDSYYDHDYLMNAIPAMKYSLYFDQYQRAHERFNGTVVAPELFTPFVNKIGFVPPARTLLCNPPQKTCNEYTAAPFQQCTHLIEVPEDCVIELVLIDEGKLLDLSHPFHLHGYSFMVMAQGRFMQEGNATTTRDKVMSMYYNGEIRIAERPILKDTVSVPDGGYAIIRFYANNYGYWLMHCHVDFHTEEGMQLVIKTRKLPASYPRSCTCFV